MTEVENFVLDNNVLSSFHLVDWLDRVSIWTQSREVLAPERVWSEFQEYWGADLPDWLNLKRVNLEKPRVQAPGALSPADWACIIVAEEIGDACVVTNDQAMQTTAERRDVSYQWGTQFLLSTFKQCGISKSELDRGIENYSSDLGLGQDIKKELYSAEK